MKINIIDSRNLRLNAVLSKIGNPIITTMLPDSGTVLPDDIKAALTLYIINSDSKSKEIAITVEANSWINKQQAITMLEHMFGLLKKFFIEKNQPLPSCHFTVFENNTFISIGLDKSDELFI